jgi:hypothetical protein
MPRRTLPVSARSFPLASIVVAAAFGHHALAFPDDLPFQSVAFPGDLAPVADGETPRSYWGRTLASDGTRLMVGARSQAFGVGLTFPTGCAEIWEFDAAAAHRGWRRVADLLPPGGVTANDRFGAAIAIEGDLAAVGASNRAVDGAAGAGAVFVYRRSADGTWSYLQKLADETPALNEHFGAGVAIDGETILVGAPGRANGGGATLFTPDARGFFGAGVSFSVPGATASNNWGEVVAFDDGIAIVGDTEAMSGAFTTGGLASFTADGSAPPVFDSVLYPPASAQSNGGLFGYWLDLDDGLLVASSPNDNQLRGAVYTYRRAKGAWIAGPTFFGTASGNRLGYVDTNGGLLAIASSSYLNPGGSLGRSWLYRIDDTTSALLASRTGDASFSQFATAVALLDGSWLVRGTTSIGTASPPRLAMQRIGDVGGDCDGDGVANAVEVASQGADDCNDDLVPTSCELADDCDDNGESDECQTAPLVVPSTTNPSTNSGIYLAGAPLWIFLARVDVPADAAAIVAIGGTTFTTNDAHNVPSYAALYVDPLGGDAPGPLTALAACETRFPMSDVPFELSIAPIPVVERAAYYVAFAGKSVSGSFPPYILTQGNPYIEGRSYFASDPSGVFDPDAIGASTAFEETGDGGLQVNLAAFVRVVTSEDANADGVPDACACVADLDADGAVGPKDLATLLGGWGGAGGDLNGDGATDAIDLGLLLGAWGPCT